jgi:hypothetical protein
MSDVPLYSLASVNDPSCSTGGHQRLWNPRTLPGLMFGFEGLRFRVEDLGFSVQGLGLRVEG